VRRPHSPLPWRAEARRSPQKAFGVYRHRNLNPSSPYLRGFSDDFSMPVSRWTEVRRADLPKEAGLEVLMESDEVGLCLINDR
jgi:homoserine O-succinyltransferase